MVLFVLKSAFPDKSSTYTIKLKQIILLDTLQEMLANSLIDANTINKEILYHCKHNSEKSIKYFKNKLVDEC